MLKQRVVTAAIGIPVIVLAIWFGDPWFSFLIAVVAVGGTFEFYRMGRGEGGNYPLIYFGLLWSLAIVLSPLSLHYQAINSLPMIMVIAIVISLFLTLFHSPRERAFRNWAWIAAGVLCVGWMLSYWLNLRILEDGRNWVYLAILTIFANDTGAFFIGREWGKHSLAPNISPGKTWEGAIGGLVSAILGAIIVMAILNLISPFALKYWQIILLGFLISLFAQLGDLVESLLKRNMGVKDSGKLLPGHGGILDRFDSFIFVGPAVYYYIVLAL
ncbi:MAG: phosphatidate cytidylyltransferase [Chloroflexota bacterium]|nr:phosphatidate cytidylyltransferase [Chloroflexota bacterium]